MLYPKYFSYDVLKISRQQNIILNIYGRFNYQMGQSIQEWTKRLSSTNFTWSIFEYFFPNRLDIFFYHYFSAHSQAQTLENYVTPLS